MNNGEDSASRTDLNHENQSSDVNYGEQTILSGGTGGSSGRSDTDNQVGNLMQDLFKILLGSLCCNQWPIQLPHLQILLNQQTQMPNHCENTSSNVG